MVEINSYIPKRLSPFIKSFWCLRVSENLDQPYIEEILPDGHHEIVFHLNSNPVRKRIGSDHWISEPTIFFTGQNRKSYVQKLDPGAIIYAIRFHPHTQHLFYNFPASLATDKLVSFSDVAARDILPGCIADTPQKTFQNFETEISRMVAKWKDRSSAFDYVDAAVRTILNRNGNVRIEYLEKITGISARHLEKSFQKFVGLSPKQFSNVIRFNHFVAYRKNYPAKSLTECAHDTQFFDQAHLIHLSHLITGKSPKSYFKKPNLINDYFLPS